ncbi:MAG: cation:proton antiporter domain-containing protein [Gemmatimonadaceae bacterium]
MIESGNFLSTLAVVCSVAAVTTVLCQRVRLPVVFGYLLAGMIVGPHVPVPLIADTSTVTSLAEVGVVLLMFSIGLEFSLRRMLRMAPVSGLVALLETSAMFGLGIAAAQLLGWSSREQLFTGAIVAISSTTIIARAFAERPVEGAVRETVFGILVFEDLIAILLLAALTALGGGALSARVVGATVLQLASFLAALIGVGLLVIPRFMRSVVRLRRAETTLVTTVGLAFAAALLAVAFGYSAALGAFLMGALVAESGTRRAIEPTLAPLRDFFAAVFFVAVGMSIEPALITRHWGAVLVITAVVMGGKITVVTVAAFLSGRDVRTSVRTAMSLAQIGEFSFIIVGVGAASGAIGDQLLPVTVAASALTTLATQPLIAVSAAAAARLDRALPAPLQTFVALYGSWFEAMRQGSAEPSHRSRERRILRLLAVDVAVLLAIIVAAAVELPRGVALLSAWLGASAHVAQLLVLTFAALAAAPLVLGLVRSAGALGTMLAERALPLPVRGADFGFAPRRALTVSLQGTILLLAGVPVIVIAETLLPPLPGAAALLGLVLVIAALLWRSAANLQGHTEAGAQLLVSAMRHQMSVTDVHAVPQPIAHAEEMLPGMGAPVGIVIGAQHTAAGRTLGALGIRARTGAAVLAITRGEEQILMPRGGDELHAGDVLALAGTREAVSAAISILAETVSDGSREDR